MSVLEQLNGGGVYLICGSIVAFIAVVCVIFMVRAWRAGKALGMDVTRMKRAVTASATFSVLPSVGILLGVIESLAKAYISTQLSNSVVFAVLIVILLLISFVPNISLLLPKAWGGYVPAFVG